MSSIDYSVATACRTVERVEHDDASAGIRCPHCGAAVREDDEICPSCGCRVVPYCTFCGSPMDWSDAECPECGAPADGIRCPSCGALSFRPFCPACNAPLTRAAVRLAEAAQRDPVYREAVEQKEKAEELGRMLEEASPSAAPRIKRELIKVTSGLNAALERMLPPAGSTPQEQRNYFSARKIAVTTRTTERVRVGWVCNYCGCTHDQPSECTKPYLGGKWVYEDVTTTRVDYIKKK